MTLHVAFVPGTTPDKWAARWRERHPEPLALALVEEADQRSVLDGREADVVLARLPIDRDGVHCIPLYTETPVVLVGREHPVAAYDAIPLADLADEQFALGVPDGLAATDQLDFPPMSVKDAVETAAAGTAVVVVPQGVARLHHRKDVVAVPVTGLPETTIGLAWLVERDEEEAIQEFIGIVRGRTANSSRGATPPAPARSRRPAPASRKPPRPQRRRRA